MLFFGKKDKPVKVGKRTMFFGRRLKEMVQLVVEGDVEIVDFTFITEPFSDVLAPDGGKTEISVISGHFEHGGQCFPVQANILTRSYDNGLPFRLEYDALQDVTMHGIKFHAFWDLMADGSARLRIQRSGNDSLADWKRSDILLRLDQLPFDQISSRRVESRLYALGIRTLGQLRQWTDSDIFKGTDDVSVVNGAQKILEYYGYKFKEKSK